MNVPLERKTVRMERYVGADTQQAVVEGSFALPANLPAIGRIVRLAAHPVITDRNPLDEEIVVHGAVDFVLVYAHDEEVVRPASAAPAPPPTEEGMEIPAEHGYDVDEEKFPSPVAGVPFNDDVSGDVQYREVLYRHRWRRGAVFETVFDVPGAHPGAVVEAKAEPLDIDVHLHSNGRGVDVEAVLAVAVRVNDDDRQAVPVKGARFPAAVKADETPVYVEHILARGRTNVSVEGLLPISTDGVQKTIVDVQAVVHLADVRLETGADGHGRMTGTGSVDYKAIVADHQGGPDVFAWQQQTPFTFSIEGVGVDGSGQGEATPVGATATVRGLDGAVAGDGRGLEVFADIDIVARAAKVEPLTLITGVAGDDDREVRFRTDAFPLEQWIGEHDWPTTVTAQLDLPEGHPPIERLLGADGRVRVEDVLVLGDKVIVEGHVDVAGFYVARTEGNPVHYVYWNRAMPLEGEVPAPGAEPGMEADVKVEVVDVNLDLLNRETVEAAVAINVRAKTTYGSEHHAVVEAVAVLPPDPDPPTFTFAVVQPDDTLWKLSHRYRTDMTDIVAANPGLESADDDLTPGRKLCIPRRKPSTPVGL